MKPWVVVKAVAVACATFGSCALVTAQGLNRADRGTGPGLAAQRDTATRDQAGAGELLSRAAGRQGSVGCPACSGISGSPAPQVGTSPSASKKQFTDAMHEAKLAANRCAKGWHWVEPTSAKAQAKEREATGKCVRLSDLDDPRR